MLDVLLVLNSFFQTPVGEFWLAAYMISGVLLILLHLLRH